MADGRWGQEGPLRDNRLSMKQYKCILIALDFRLRVTEDKEKWRHALAFFLFFLLIAVYVWDETTTRPSRQYHSISCSYCSLIINRYIRVCCDVTQLHKYPSRLAAII